NGQSPLHCAALNGSEDVVKMLLEAKANPSIADKNKKTPLDVALENCHSKAVQLLREAVYPKVVPIEANDLSDVELLSTSDLIQTERGLYNGQPVLIETLLKPSEDALEIIRSYAKVEAPFVLPLLAYVPDNPIKIVMPLVSQGNLRDHLNNERATSSIFTSRFEVAYILAKALQDLHDNQLVHRDLTSRSIVRVNDSWKLKLSYFGYTKELGAQSTVESVEEMLWSAPEVIASNKYTYASDIYSFGVILSEMDTWKSPYEESKLNGFGLMLAIHKGEVQISLRDNCEPWYRELALRCLNENPSLRPKVNELVEAFKNAANDPMASKTTSPISIVEEELLIR
ncbi:kinase, partial [Thraustotheca clavata]